MRGERSDRGEGVKEKRGELRKEARVWGWRWEGEGGREEGRREKEEGREGGHVEPWCWAAGDEGHPAASPLAEQQSALTSAPTSTTRPTK